MLNTGRNNGIAKWRTACLDSHEAVRETSQTIEALMLQAAS
jgi:hypothetical protein